MGAISVTVSGNTDNIDRFLKNMQANTMFDALDVFGQQGVAALETATPRDTGVAAGSWYYDIVKTAGGATIAWKNFDSVNGVPIVILLQYGHRTGTGGWVEGRDFINPALNRVFINAINEVWKAVQS